MTAQTQQTQDTQQTSTTDRIEKRVVLRATRARVWRAITNAKEFGTWFRMNLDGEFAAGKTMHGNITHPGYEHVKVEMRVERIQPESYFSYRWHPYAIDTAVDYSAEPMTLVEFKLEDADEGIAVTIIESGFDKVPLARRAEAFRMNEKGWGGQIKNLERHVS
ncbi:MAG TPA: SRPBCC family protein [Gemmatimonadaceae bacterium]|nr:SRPBCC family protein [Gemmatimonadaceae bacterium]